MTFLDPQDASTDDMHFFVMIESCMGVNDNMYIVTDKIHLIMDER